MAILRNTGFGRLVTLSNDVGQVVRLSSGSVGEPVKLVNSGGEPIQTADVPLAISGLQFWVKSSDVPSIALNGSNVTQWNDKSGRNLHVTQANAANQPVFLSNQINGKPALSFNGTSQRLANAVAAVTTTNNVTIFTVIKPASASARGAAIKIGSGSQGYSLGIGNGNFDVNGNEIIGLYEFIRFLDSNIVAGTDAFLSEMSINSSGVPSFSKNGAAPVTLSGTGAVAPTSLTSVGGDGTRLFNGLIGEIMIYSRDLTSTEKEQIRSYLNSEWALYSP